MYIADKILPELPAPSNTKGIVHWLKDNLFSSPLNSLFTLFVIYKLLPTAIDWAFIDATWVAETREQCKGEGSKGGACWAFIANRFDQTMYGF